MIYKFSWVLSIIKRQVTWWILGISVVTLAKV